MKKENFVNISNDDKQIILATNFWTEEDEASIGRFRSIIFFVKDSAGNLKLLIFSPTKGGATMKGEASREELEARIVRYTEDKDSDGREDYFEECLSDDQGNQCIKTDPKLRDTDMDGWWDGIEVFF